MKLLWYKSILTDTSYESNRPDITHDQPCMDLDRLCGTVVDTFGTISRNLSASQDALKIPDNIGSAQVVASPGTAHAMRNVLCL